MNVPLYESVYSSGYLNMPVRRSVQEKPTFFTKNVIIIILIGIIIILLLLIIGIYFLVMPRKIVINKNIDLQVLIEYYHEHFGYEVSAEEAYTKLIDMYKISDAELINIIHSDSCTNKFSDKEIDLFYKSLCIYDDKLIVPYTISNCDNTIIYDIHIALDIYSGLDIIFNSFDENIVLEFECSRNNYKEPIIIFESKLIIKLPYKIDIRFVDVIRHLLSHIFLGNHINLISSLRFNVYGANFKGITDDDKNLFMLRRTKNKLLLC
ncbi:hypothetical protein [Alphaentomopoxvirus acuprea]|uniref:Uncharacterized protein n=1 Tax=Alphaentomopoxvirus acuprea TaxID=62099 RepID=W6JPJ3_9POXV|nr:hypothetical protein BA82_gp019 [Anomala cuprea entomopoxvirus]YP_009001718.1 hypothetical protein BA82_gp245 [Anomala cuprea entomopoxvirus]BAO49379.1 hypothetical protein [Anomala cuprea entomopoxvirus]BAO49605.1 hypothetical protein [Anomala cuprea entomopoxvirus]